MRLIRGLPSTACAIYFQESVERSRLRPLSLVGRVIAVQRFALAAFEAQGYSIKPVHASNFAPESS
jgi:hypothetical protein